MDLLKDGLAWLTNQLRDFASQEVIYGRVLGPARAGFSHSRFALVFGPYFGKGPIPFGVTLTVHATFGQKLLQLQDVDGGIRMEWTDMDFLIPADEMIEDDGTPLIPQRGDLVSVALANGTQIFEVLPVGSEPPWRWSDPHQSMFRVHAKWVDVESLRR